jgi:acyl transferase domain-containing protein/3-hydroxymyristoyl/3-hydroxydecanoyl-(acyl carrier protein) dehydratase
MSSFEPIAIVGRSCVLPGALSPEALFEAVREARVLIGEAPEGAWGIDSRKLIASRATGPGDEYVVSNRGGYVRGFDEIFDDGAFADRIDRPERLDPLTKWLLHCAGVALGEAGVDSPPPGTGLVIGNLSYPTVGHTRFVQDFWLGEGDNAPRPGLAGVTSDPRNRFSSGAPAHIVAAAYGLTGDAFALDAACASSLYALEIACRRLQNREADLMLAGGVARADPLFIHLGFTALQALSPSGRSRPMHKGADGLLPAEGAGLVALKRLDDAIASGDTIFGVIRAVGLSNDGRQSGFLAPATDGQIRAMKAAYAQCGLTPQDIGFIECHATGTPRGDTVELESLASIWGDGPKPAIGSLKGIIGHPITASGIASLLKMLSAFEAGLLPPTPCDDPLDEIDAYGFRLLSEAEPWESDGPRRAAISNFGFGGNNAHLIVEEWTGEAPTTTARGASVGVGQEQTTRVPIAISGIGVIAGESVGLPDFVRRLVDARDDADTRTSEIVLSMTNLGFPPNDLQESLAQQTSILAVVEEALGQVGELDPERTGVYIGMCVDPQASRHGLRVRLRELLSDDADIAGWRDVNERSARHLTAAGVIGCMPNIPANRVHAQRDWRSPGFTIASEELSGVDALKLAVRALQAGDIDAALVGACDFSLEEAHRAAAAAVLPDDRQRPGDAAVALVLMRAEHAAESGYPVIASLVEGVDAPEAGAVELRLSAAVGESEVSARFGHAHGASGLLHVAAGAVAAHLGATIDRAGAWPAPRHRDLVHTRATTTSFTGREASVTISASGAPVDAIAPVDAPVIHFHAADSMTDLAADLVAGVQNYHGRVRVALVGKTPAEVDRLGEYAATELGEGQTPAAPGLFFGEGSPEGEVAFCYTGAAAAYPGAARDLLLAFPSMGHNLAARFAGTPQLAATLYGAGVEAFSPATQLQGSSFVCQVHTEFTRDVLGMRPQVALGLSSGETNSLMAFGVWHDLDDMLLEIDSSEMYVNQLTGECRSAAEYWGLPRGEIPRWKNFRIAAPLEAVEAAVADEDRVYVTVIHHYEDIVIGGDAEGCDRVVEKVGRNKAIDLGLDMVVHCAPLGPFEKTWHDIHLRDTRHVPDIRFYTNAGNREYVPTRQAAAAAITQQAIDPVDFPKTIERAYADGVRIFIEHGPRAIVTGAVGRILEGRPHMAVALDPHEGAGLEAVGRSVAKLWATGVPMELDTFVDRLRGLREGRQPLTEPAGALLRLPAHAPPVVWPDSFGDRMNSTQVDSDRMASDQVDSDRIDADQVDLDPVGAGTSAFTPMETAVVNEMVATNSSPDGDTMAPPPADGGLGYDVSRQFEQSRPVVGAPTATGPASEGVAARVGDRPTGNPAVDLFSSIARVHADFLREQKETHDAFLAIGVAAAAEFPALGDGLTTSSSSTAGPGSGSAAPTAGHTSRVPDLRVVVNGVGAVTETPAPMAPAAARMVPTATTTEVPTAAPVAPPVPAPESPTTAKTSSAPSPVIPIAPPINRDELPETVFLTREQLEVHAGGKISEIFGELFEQQDGYERQVRMPEPPLLFSDRALVIEGEPGSMKKGRVVTETDVADNAWYLHAGRMAPGVVIESGQADLLLISWLGADFANKSDRVYRLLGCDLTFYGGLPAPGETLTYEIFVDGHAKTGDVRLFFFHYDCYVGDRLLISVRNGQAGFFTEEELAGSGGVLWDAADDDPDPDARLDPAPQLTTRRSFTAEEVGQWVEGDAFACFGEGFEMASCHTRTPSTPDGRLRLIDEVPVFEPEGGPWGRGYLRATAHVPADAWFYSGHFKNDPCMPGTLMADAATQALSFAMAAMGFTIARDGWRFEPVPGELARFLCRGQVIPDGAHDLEYEVFIEEVIDGDLPEVYASLLCSSDGFKVFQCRRFGMRLVPDYPLTTRREFLEGAEPLRFVGPGDSDVRGDYEGLLSCAWGKPSDAFGKMFEKFDGPLKCPRLPGPPYHFMSSIVEVDVAPGSAPSEGTLVSTFDIDPDAWYFAEGQGNMPFAVLVEAILQPCGWFASYLNYFADTPGDVAFRNLDGEECIVHKQVAPDVGTLRLTTRLTRFAKAGGTSIVFFEVVCEDTDGLVMTLKTDFGFFSPKILEDQKGLPMTDEMRARRDEESPMPVMSLVDGGGDLAHLPSMESGTMRMLDEVTGFWPDAGEAGLGRIRTFQEIRSDAWYFKAHFYEDPVQPGSLGLEALVQSARALVHLKGWLEGLENPVWEHPIIGFPLAWRYRGQVVPMRDEVITEVEALKVDIVEGESVTVEIFGTQWVDGLRIYEVPSFAIRVRAG